MRKLENDFNNHCKAIGDQYCKTPAFPNLVKIEAHFSCNYSCLFCPQSKMKNKRGDIDYDLCQRLIKEAFEAGAREISFSSTGEPLLNRNLEDHIQLAKSVGYKYIYINTNGYLATPDRVKTLVESGLDSIKFSVNASRDDYKTIHGVDGFDKVIGNIKAAFDYRKEGNKKFNIYASFVETAGREDSIAEAIKTVRPMVDEVLTIKVSNRGGQMDEMGDDMYAGENESLFKYPCGFPFNTAYVSAEGYMLLCCQDFLNETVIADLNKTSIADAWVCEKYQDFRDRYIHKNLKGTLCQNCHNNTNEPVIPMSTGIHAPVIDKGLEQQLHVRMDEFLNQGDKSNGK